MTIKRLTRHPLSVLLVALPLTAVAQDLGMSLYEAASGIIDVVNDHMVRALRVMSVQRGEDPKEYTLVSFGGAGGLHVCALADALQMRRALVPANAGVLSALGMLAAEPSRERSMTIQMLLKNCNTIDIEDQYRQLHEIAEQELREITGDQDMQAQYSVDLRYTERDLFNVDQLNFSSELRLLSSNFRSDNVLDEGIAPETDRDDSNWRNELNYRIGLLEFRLFTDMRRAESRWTSQVFFMVRRYYGVT